MTIISHYVFRQAGNALLLILLSLSGIVWIALALSRLSVVTTQGQNAWTLFAMTTLALPNLMALVAPFALLIGALHTLNRMNGDSEIIVLTAGGATVWTVGRPLLILAAITAVGVAAVNHWAMPASLRLLREYVIEVRTDLLTQVIQPGRFSSPEDDITFHIRARTPSGELLGLLMHDTSKTIHQSYLAERAIIVKQDRSAYLVMSNGHILRRPSREEPAQIIAFEKYAIDLNRFEPKDDDVSDLKPRERYFDELAFPNPNSPSFRRYPGQFRAELHERFATPLYPFAFVLMALACVGRARSTRQGLGQMLVLAIALAVGCRLLGLAANNLATLNPWGVILLYIVPLGGALAAGTIIVRDGQRQAKSGGAGGGIFGGLRGLFGGARPSPALARGPGR